MTQTKPNEESLLYNTYPSAWLYWDIINRVDESLSNLPKDLFLLPSRLKNAQSTLKKLNSLKTDGFYRDLADDDELMRIHKALEHGINKLNKKLEELKIKEVDDTELGKYYSFEDCSMVDERLQLDADKYTEILIKHKCI